MHFNTGNIAEFNIENSFSFMSQKSCYTLPFLGATAYTASPGAGNTVPLLFSNVRCTGSEATLTSCPYDSNLGLCTLAQPAAGVTCHMCKPCYIVLCEMMRTHSRALNYVLLKKLCPNSPIFFIALLPHF